MKINLTMVFDKETKNTLVYAAKATGAPPAIRSIYVEKWAITGERPDAITLRIEAGK